MRDLYAIPDFKKIDQGMIFTGGIATNYNKRKVLGLIISPRCDIAHKKNEEVHYLPLVSLNDWLAVDGKIILIEISRNAYLAKFRAELIKNKIDDSILRNNKIEELEIIIEKLIPKENKRKLCIDYLKTLKELEELELNKLHQKQIEIIYKREEKHIKGVLKELAENKRKEYYLIDPINDKDYNSYYVVLNREIKRLDYSIAAKMHGGIFLSEIERSDTKYCDIDFNLDDGIIVPIKILNSPYMEHLIQHFMSNFNRIGVTDHENNLSDSLINKIKYNEILIY